MDYSGRTVSLEIVLVEILPLRQFFGSLLIVGRQLVAEDAVKGIDTHLRQAIAADVKVFEALKIGAVSENMSACVRYFSVAQVEQLEPFEDTRSNNLGATNISEVGVVQL